MAWCDNTGESWALLLRAGSAGSHTVSDHLEVLDEAITQIPARHRRDLLITVDGAGASHGLLEHITTLNIAPGRTVHYSIGGNLAARERAAIAQVPASAWDAVLDTHGDPRDLDEAGVVEVTSLLREHPDGDHLANWPADMRIIARREKPHPGAQLSLFEKSDEWRYQPVATNTPAKTAQFLETRHQPHTRIEDRNAKDTGIGHLPSTSIDINRAWCLAATLAINLLAWFRLLCLEGPLAKAEPTTLRYRLLHTPYPHRPRPTHTHDPHPRDLALGTTTTGLLHHHVRPTPTDLTSIIEVPIPNPKRPNPDRGTGAHPTRQSGHQPPPNLDNNNKPHEDQPLRPQKPTRHPRKRSRLADHRRTRSADADVVTILLHSVIIATRQYSGCNEPEIIAPCTGSARAPRKPWHKYFAMRSCRALAGEGF